MFQKITLVAIIIFCLGFISCKETNEPVIDEPNIPNEPQFGYFKDDFVFIEYDVLTSWSTKGNIGTFVYQDSFFDYDFSDHNVLKIKQSHFIIPAIDSETKLLIGTLYHYTPECGQGSGGIVIPFKNYYSVDTLCVYDFPQLKHRVEILGCDNECVVTFKLDDNLFELKPNEVYVDTFTVQDFHMRGLDYNFAKNVVSIKNSGLIKKNNVIIY